jgi:hypothetical protein
VDGIKFLAELTTGLTELVLGDGIPEPVLGIGSTKADLAADDLDFINVLCDHMVDGVPQLSG